MSKKNLKEILTNKAISLGFDDLGVCKACEVDEETQKYFAIWLNEKCPDYMAYLKKNLDKRFNPALLLENAKSIIVLSANFYRKTTENRIALYAQSKDYHIVLKEKLQVLSALLEEEGGTQKICVDSAPIMEKYFAQKAGLGFIGKNTLLISKNAGAFNFLSIIITTLEIDSDSEIQDSCGKCNKCVQSCPTKALSEYSLNPNLCISALTIEKSTKLSDSEKKLVGEKIFGCDICLKVCPKSKYSSFAKIPEFQNSFEYDKSKSSLQDFAGIATQTPLERRLKKSIPKI